MFVFGRFGLKVRCGAILKSIQIQNYPGYQPGPFSTQLLRHRSGHVPHTPKANPELLDDYCDTTGMPMALTRTWLL